MSDILNGALPYMGALHQAPDKASVLAILAQWIDEGQEASDPALACPSWAQHTYRQLCRKPGWKLWKVYGCWDYSLDGLENEEASILLGVSPRCCSLFGRGRRRDPHEWYWNRLIEVMSERCNNRSLVWNGDRFYYLDTHAVPDVAIDTSQEQGPGLEG